MSQLSLPSAPLFHTPQPSVAQLPHLITALDPRFLNGIVGINGAKMGVWRLAAPFDENDTFAPYREGVPLNAWTMAYNQGELLACRNIVSDESIMIVDAGADETVLAAAEDGLRDLHDGQTPFGYQDHPQLPALVAKIGWAVIPVGANLEHALFAASPAKRDLVNLLKSWCHTHGRAYSTVAGETLTVELAPEDNRVRLIFDEGAEFLNKLALFGIKGDEVQAWWPKLLEMIRDSGAQAR